MRDLCRKYVIDESYARGIARQALKLDALSDIGTLDARSLVTALRAMKIQTARATEVEFGVTVKAPNQDASRESGASQ